VRSPRGECDRKHSRETSQTFTVSPELKHPRRDKTKKRNTKESEYSFLIHRFAFS
jgi:hypothetical protein